MASPRELLQEICRLGQGEIAEHVLCRNLDISHGHFCMLRKRLVEQQKLVVTHPCRRAFYTVTGMIEDDDDCLTIA